MKQSSFILILLLSSLFSSDLVSANSKIDHVVRSEMKRQKLVGLGLGIVSKDKVIYLKGYGLADQESKTKVDPNKTLFYWMSLSKTITSTLIVKAASMGKLDLDADVRMISEPYKLSDRVLIKNSKVETDLPKDNARITLRQILTHTSGITGYVEGGSPPEAEIFNEKINDGFEWAFKYWINKPLVSIPGGREVYSNYAYSFAGFLLEKIMQQSFEELADHWIKKPAKLNSLQVIKLSDKPKHLAQGYKLSNKGIIETDPVSNESWRLPAAGFVATVRDLAEYCKGHLNETFLEKTWQAQLWQKQKKLRDIEIERGLGFYSRIRDGKILAHHTGSHHGYQSLMYLYPKDNLCIVITANTRQGNLATVSFQVEDIVRYGESKN